LAASILACTSANPAQPTATNPYAPLATLRAEAAADLATPGSSLIRTVGAEGFMNITGWQAAFYGHVYGTQQTNDDVFAFYNRELMRLGWKPDLKPILSSGELHGWGWCKPSLFFRLAIFDPQQYARVGITDGDRYRTVYDARLQGNDRSLPRDVRAASREHVRTNRRTFDRAMTRRLLGLIAVHVRSGRGFLISSRAMVRRR